MEKYASLSKITNQYLNGQLAQLQVMYEDNDHMKISLIYEDKYHYWFDYEMSISIPTKQIQYAKHFSEGYMNKIELDRENDFELAVFQAVLNV
jgi:hypothetical protein